MSRIQPRAAGEPTLRIPQPPGWQHASMLDSAIIRYTMGNRHLAADGFVPTAVVTLESAPGTIQDQQKIFDQERTTLADRVGVTNLQTTDTTLCGRTAELVSYDAPAMGRIPPRKARTLIVIGAFNGNTYAATVTVQATEPDNPTYAHDAETILTGFQMLPPDA
jgi:Probable lipoprotein LpqN